MVVVVTVVVNVVDIDVSGVAIGVEFGVIVMVMCDNVVAGLVGGCVCLVVLGCGV